MNKFQFPIIIKKVYDGDTVIADIDLGFNIFLKAKSIRITGIDTPEIRTKNPVEKEAGLVVRDKLRELLIIGQEYILISKELDKFGRILGDVILNNSMYLSEYMISSGYALSYDGGTKEIFSEEFLSSILKK